MLQVASVCTPCFMLLDVVACCCAKFETGQTFQPTTLNISFVPWSPKRSATMLDLFAQLFQHCWGHARSLRIDYKDLWVVFFPRCTAGPNIVGSCYIRLHTTANMDATTPTIVGATMLGVVASAVCTHPYVSLGVVASVRTPLPTRTQQLPTMLGVVESFARRRRFRYFLVHDWPSGIVILGYLAQVSTNFS